MATRSTTTVSREDCERLHAELLRLGAHGAHRAVPRRLLAETFGSDRRLRHVMAAAPGFGVAVGSTEDGYFAIARAERAVVLAPRPNAPYQKDHIEVAPCVYAQEVYTNDTSAAGGQVMVAIDLPSLRRLLHLTEIGDQPPQGSV